MLNGHAAAYQFLWGSRRWQTLPQWLPVRLLLAIRLELRPTGGMVWKLFPELPVFIKRIRNCKGYSETNFKSKPESKFISLRHVLVNARAYFFHGLFLILHGALWFRIPSLRQSRGVHAALCPELLCWSFAFWKIPVSWRPVPGGKGFPVMLPEPWKEENNCLISFWKIKQPNKNNTELMNKSFF